MHKRGVVGYSKKTALLEEAITHMNTGKYGRSSAALKDLLSLDPHNTEARRLFATLHLRLGSLATARQAFESLANEAIGRQDFWLAESLLREYLAAGPRCVPFLELLAHVYEEKGDALAAVAELGKAIDILIEGPDSENPKKPSQLYAKVRELAPASSVAFQFASLFDIQTGELLVPHPLAPAAVTSLEIDASQPQDKILATTEESRASDVMPWEQFEGAPPSHGTPPPTSSNPVIELLDVPDVSIDPAPVGLVPQELDVPPSESAGLIQEANRLDPDLVPSMLAEPPLPSKGHRDYGMGGPIVEPSSFEGEGLSPSSSEERTTDVGRGITSFVGSQGLSSPMPWEQIENSTIRIEEATPSSTPLAQSEGTPLLGSESVLAQPATTQPEFVSDQLSSPAPAPDPTEPSESIFAVAPSTSPAVLPEPEVLTPSATTQPESVSGHLASPTPVPDLTEPSESVFAVEPSTNPPVLPEPEVPIPSAADSSSAVPFSWNTVFDGAWKFAAGTLSSSSPAAVSKPDAISQDARDLGSVQPESVPDPEVSASSITSTSEPPVSFGDPEPLPSAHPLILSEVNEVSESIAETDAIRESDLPQSTEVLLSEEPLRPEEPLTISSAIPSSFMVDLPVPPLSEPVEPARESEPVSSPALLEPQPVAPLPEVSAPESSCSTVIPEALPAPEPVSTEHHEIPITPFQTAEAPPLSAALSNAPSASPASMDTLSHWSTGEVGVQPHRPSEKKRKWDKKKGKAPVVPPAPLPLVEELSEAVSELSRTGGWESAPSEAAAPVVEEVVLQEDTRPEWVRASESITFVKPSPSSPETWQDSGVESTHSEPEPATSVAASAVDVLFNSTGERSQVRTQNRLASPRPRRRFAARVARVRIGISSFIGSCFSTTRSIVLLCLGLALFCVVLAAIGIGAVGLAWMVMEAPPSPVYHNLTTSPPLALTDSRKNGYFLLLGFDASAEQDPLQAGYERKVAGNDFQAANACMLGDEGKGTTTGASDNVVRGWFTSADPVAQLKPQAAAVRSWAAQESLALRRYQQWLSMPFEDVGYGQILSPNCAHILLAHRVYLAEGFAQDLSTGLGRLETDIGSWRAVLGQSKTLMVKMLAATAVQDDVAIASGLLTRQDLDGTAIGRLGKIVRPFDQVELSLRWPMQSHLVWATKATTTSLKNDKTNERPLYVALAAAMPLPVQRRSNAYADYYEAASKAVAEGRYTNLPKPSSFIRTPAVSVVDYVANPIEHIIGIEPLPSWDPYVGRMVETDARLRLASLQYWIRRGAQEENVLTRLAKAGQAHYDPFTGLPMLVDQQKGVMYSVGQDGKDQEGDPLRDVVATIPKTQSVVLESRRSVSSPRSK
ncbi:MAG TPA: tetratricopeptide repeat protein [Nitrospiraceae bacterium]